MTIGLIAIKRMQSSTGNKATRARSEPDTPLGESSKQPAAAPSSQPKQPVAGAAAAKGSEQPIVASPREL